MFYHDVLPILQNHCQECHRPGEIGPMPLLTYREVRPWAKAIRDAVVTAKMPPWFADPRFGKFANDRRLSQAEIDTIRAWADAGAPAGSAEDGPAPRLGRKAGPSARRTPCFACRSRFAVPASGELSYQYIIVPTGLRPTTGFSRWRSGRATARWCITPWSTCGSPNRQWLRDKPVDGRSRCRCRRSPATMSCSPTRPAIRATAGRMAWPS